VFNKLVRTLILHQATHLTEWFEHRLPKSLAASVIHIVGQRLFSDDSLDASFSFERLRSGPLPMFTDEISQPSERRKFFVFEKRFRDGQER
jgi:hypothetical protein